MLTDETKNTLKYAVEHFLKYCPNFTASPKQILHEIGLDPRRNQNEKTKRVRQNIEDNMSEAEHLIGCYLGLNG